MQRYGRIALLVAGLATAGLPAAAAQAPDTNERTKITVDTALEVPGTTLQPGVYWFELLDSKASRQAIRIRNEDESKTIATLIAVPVYRQLDDTRGKTELVLSPVQGGGAAALEAWFFPGKQYGHQFVYPKAQARQIAERSKHVVLADDDGKVVRLNPAGISEPWAPDADKGTGDKGNDRHKENKNDKK